MSELRVNRIQSIDGSSTVEFATGVSGNAEGLRFEPKVTAFDPTNLATGVDRNLTHINVTFDQPIEFSGVGTVRIRAGVATGTVYEEYTCGVSTNLIISGETLRINLTSGTLDGTSTYFVTLPSVGIANTYTQYYKGTENYVFTTQDATFNIDGGDYQQIVSNPSSPTNYYKYNIFHTSGIATFSAPSASAEDFSYMLIGGGGGGGGGNPTQSDGYGGGGGAGGLLVDYNSGGFAAGELTVTIGGGGIGVIARPPTGSLPPSHPQFSNYFLYNEPGNDSTLGPTPVGTISAYGGGRAGHGKHDNNPFTVFGPTQQGQPGGSGGGGSKAGPNPPATAPSDNIPGQPIIPGGDSLGYPGPAAQGYPGGYTYSFPYPYNDNSLGSGGGGGAGQAGEPEVRYNPHHSPNRYNLPSTACQGGDGAPNPKFNSSVLSYINGMPTTIYQAVGPQGIFAGGGGGSVRGYSNRYPTNPNSPNYYTPTTTGQGGEGGGGRGNWYSPPTNPFGNPTPGHRYAEKGIDGIGGGGGGGSMGPNNPWPNPQYPVHQIDPSYAPPTWAPQRPQWSVLGAPGGSGGFYVRYAHPGSV